VALCTYPLAHNELRVELHCESINQLSAELRAGCFRLFRVTLGTCAHAVAQGEYYLFVIAT
jgi:hypothetical protein